MILNKNELLTAIQACINSYPTKENINKAKFGVMDWSNLVRHENFDFNNCEGFIAQRWAQKNETLEKTLYICFRGSDEPLDWQENFDFKKMVSPYGNTDSKILIHKGFMETYNNARKFILDKVKNEKRVVVTGHSLGGALATLCAVDIQYNYPEIELACCPFASPRVGNRDFAASFNKRVPSTYRIYLENDPVVDVPLEIMGYKHVSTPYKFKAVEWWGWLATLPIVRASNHYPDRLQASMRRYL